MLKTDHLAKALAHARVIAFKNGQFRSRYKNAKGMRKNTLQEQ